MDNLKVAVRYFSKSGHTKKVAEAIAGALNCTAMPISVPVDAGVDLLFLGASVYWGGISSDVKEFIDKLDKDKIGKVVVFSTSALAERAFPQIKQRLQDKGIRVEEKNFYCRGEFTALHKGHPNDDDLKAAKKFACAVLKGE
ncbi:MAG: flavodoxin [Oscillospiraceae bacterium]|nr:flavodoxin [Oscillospiraceae bacterium]